MSACVLIVEDDDEMSRLLQIDLKRNGYEALIARNGLDATGNKIWGTPRAKNSVLLSPTEISQNLPFDHFGLY